MYTNIYVYTYMYIYIYIYIFFFLNKPGHPGPGLLLSWGLLEGFLGGAFCKGGLAFQGGPLSLVKAGGLFIFLPL